MQGLKVMTTVFGRMIEWICAGRDMFADSQSMACEGVLFLVSHSRGSIAVTCDD